MTITDDISTTDHPEPSQRGPVTVDLYRDIHKGLRAELFALTVQAGRLDPSDHADRAALADHVASMRSLLESHARHEDTVIQPALHAHLPELATRIEQHHTTLEPQFVELDGLASALVDAPGDHQRLLAHQLHLELSRFTGDYLLHQLVEEHVVGPALEQAVGVEAVVAMHVAIVSSIPPDEMARSLSFMLPAMNADDRAELLGGIRASAPQEAFAGVVGLARSVLLPADFAATAARMGGL